MYRKLLIPSIGKHILTYGGAQVIEPKLVKDRSIRIVFATIRYDRCYIPISIRFFIGVYEMECHEQWHLYSCYLYALILHQYTYI